MSRRVLPSRATRGTKPAKTIEEENKDNQIYAKMFGNDLDDDDDYQQKKAQQNVRKERTTQNLRKYSYARGYTYCYNLDIFPRLQNHPSYAVDQTNVFDSTYSQQHLLFKNNSLASLINRIYFGLPITENQERKGESNTKNICHYYLFENQDKKYHLDRTIFSYKKIYKNLEQILVRGKIDQFVILKKDPELQQIIKSNKQIQQKRQFLLKKIKILQQRKGNNVNYWYYEDQLFYHHSLNQKLHCQIEETKKRVQASRMHALVYENQYYHKTIIEQQEEYPQEFLRNIFTYYNSTQPVVSQQLITYLLENYSKSIITQINNEPKISFPCQFFSFGSHHLIQVLNSILSTKIQNMNEANYYTAKFAWRKLFKFQLLPNKLEKLKIQEYTALAKKLVQQSKYYYKRNAPLNVFEEIKLDDLINFEQLQQQSTPNISILKPGEVVEINSKEVMIICLYNWICQAFVQLLPFVDKYREQFTHFMICELFGKYSHGLVQATAKPIIGTLKSNIQFLCDVLGTESIGTMDFVLRFQYDKQRNIGILWKRKIEENEWQTQKEQSQQINMDEQMDEQIVDSLKKRIKQNQQ